MQGGLQVWHADVHTCPTNPSEGAEPLARHDSGREPNLRMATRESHVKTGMRHMMYKLDFNEHYYTITSVLLKNIVLCGKFHCTKSIDFQCFRMKL